MKHQIVFLFALAISVFAACRKDNIDHTSIDEDTVNPIVKPINCDSLTVTINSDLWSGDTLILQALCNNGAPPYSYFWTTNAGNQQIILSTSQHMILFANGSYSVLVTDSNGCKVTETIVVNSFVPGNSPLKVVIESKQMNSDEMELSATAMNGSGPYFYQWSHGLQSQTIDIHDNGPYSVTVVDATGSTAVGQILVSTLQPGGCEDFEVDIDGTAPNLIANASGGAPPYSILWSTGELTQSIPISSNGMYSVTATDGNGCTAADVVVISADPCSAYDGYIYTMPLNSNLIQLKAIASGGVQPYGYLWSTGALSSSLIGQTGASYTVKITDAQGCVNIVSIQL
jgi:hypothetical protein